ncbi:MAG TPA: carboxypeptidase-like regulatory domain-containing protein, partial [Gemmatimonadaceae bacterium]|nr:carboxypeptidase-like regulatory domain-containing protein [Gemmatimonadaceae bacterium]
MRRLVLFAALVGLAPSAVAQVTPTGGNITISGTVIGTNGIPLPYSTVSIVETGAHRFANENGSFVITNLAPGSYHLRVKQLGFTARDTLIQVSAAAAQQIRVALEPSPFKLATVTIKVSKACIPGDAPRSDVNFETILAELRNNAERERLLVTSYPFEYRLARIFETPIKADMVRRGFDTTSYRSDERPRYE